MHLTPLFLLLIIYAIAPPKIKTSIMVAIMFSGITISFNVYFFANSFFILRFDLTARNIVEAIITITAISPATKPSPTVAFVITVPT